MPDLSSLAQNLLLAQVHLSPLVSNTGPGSLLHTLTHQISRDSQRYIDVINSVQPVGVGGKAVKECSDLAVCLQFSATLQSTIFIVSVSKQKHKPLVCFSHKYLLPAYVCFCFAISPSLSLPLSALSTPSAHSHLFILLSRTNKHCFKLRDEEWLSAQCVQLVSISWQGGEDDRERCWNESSVWAPSLFNLSY